MKNVNSRSRKRQYKLSFVPVFFFCLLILMSACSAAEDNQYVSEQKTDGGFCLAGDKSAAALCVDADDYAGVRRAVGDLQADIARVTGRKPTIINTLNDSNPSAVIIGTVGKSSLIDRLVENGKIDVSPVEAKWESFLIQTVSNPLPGMTDALVIAGSDKRGTIYGIYDLCEQIGVSPWHWWADVPVKTKDAVYIKPIRAIQPEPAVKYRGIFLNDEGFALSPWVNEKFGNYNSEFYAKVFELLLRLKANFLWPAMWNNAFADDDPRNDELADEYGIVMGTSHHEPMNRAHKEWSRYGEGPWDYAKNPETLREFWEKGVRRSRDFETVITLAMRGDGDIGMSEETNIALLEKIVADQRKIIADVMDPNPSDIPQVWALYKEVQDYYDKGMRVPEDITLLLCDDNWGNVRILPDPDAPPRPGGYGMYYHFDFYGGPRSYIWLNTNPIARVWEQMHLSYRHGVDRIWIVNVGDLKPMEFPISFFLDYALNPDKWPAESLPQYTRQWAAQQFGPEHADAIADILTKYTKYNGRRTPEMLSPDTYSLVNYREADSVAADYNRLVEKAERIGAALPDRYRDAYFQLVLHPVLASANLNELYVTAAKNRLYAEQGRAATNETAQKVKALFEKDAGITDRYHNLAGGKWNHMMDTPHIGYTSWRQPPQNNMPDVKTIQLPDDAQMGIAVEGSENAWPDADKQAVLPEFDKFNRQTSYIEVFNRGKASFDFTAQTSQPWLHVAPEKDTVKLQQRLTVSVDWEKVPAGTQNAFVKITGPDAKTVSVKAVVKNPESPKRDRVKGFVESRGVVSIEAEHTTNAVAPKPIEWLTIPDLGRTLSGVTPTPVTAEAQTPAGSSPRLEYSVYLFTTGDVTVHAYLSPTQNFKKKQGLRYAVSFDDEKPQIVNIHEKDTKPDWEYPPEWNKAVGDSIKILTTEHTIEKAGPHVLKFWMIDPGIVLQKLVIDAGGLKPSYLGPPESFRGPAENTNENTKTAAGAYESGRYRNLFAEVGYAPEQVTAKVNAAFEQLFHGDPDTEALYFAAGKNDAGPLAYICDINNNDVRSEGMSYGMMIAVQLDKKAEFDALWNWAKTCMYHDNRGHPAYGYFSWSMQTDGTPNDEMPAPDGEEYFAMALYFADARWGSAEGLYNYKKYADRLLDDMKNRKPITGPTLSGVRTGLSLFDAEHKMVRFTPDSNNAEHTDPSYHLPAFYQLWALWGPQPDRAFWEQAADASRDFFLKAAHPETALTPEYADFDGSPWSAPWRPDSIHFQYDAWRTAMNWAMDWAWWGKDPRQRQLSDRLQAFFHARGMDDYPNRYTLDGEPIGRDHSTGLVAMNAVASLAATGPRAQEFVKAFWEIPVPTGRYRYYDGMLYMLGLLHCSGRFQIHQPDH